LLPLPDRTTILPPLSQKSTYLFLTRPSAGHHHNRPAIRLDPSHVGFLSRIAEVLATADIAYF